MSLLISTPAASGRTFGSKAVLWCACLAISATAVAQDAGKFYVREYRVQGGKRLSSQEIGEAVYPYLGPGRTADDVEQARQALEKVYHDKGYQTVSVSIPQQDPGRGVIRLSVTEGKVARLHVSGAKWHLPSRIRREVPSVSEGSVPDFKQVEKEIIAANRLADRRVTPYLKPGEEPGTVDIELKVEDKFPLHGSLELNNRNSADTTPLRLNGSLSYANLFQLGHTLGANGQIAPENTDDALVYSAFYLARVSEKASLMLNATKQDSDISTLGGSAVVGRGEVVGLRAMIDLPRSDKFYQSFDIGIDAKKFDEDIVFKDGDDKDKKPDVISSPIEYYPISANYSANWLRKKHFTELNTSLTFNLRGLGSDEPQYSDKRFNSSGSFFYLRADAAHTHDIKGGGQIFGKIQGQAAGSPLINNEQFSGGGLGTARGYLESTLLGDNGFFVTAELRSPTLIGKGDTSPDPKDEWRFHAFTDAGIVGIYDPLPGQKKRSGLSSIGLGSRLRIHEHYNASVDVAMPLIEQTDADDRDIRITFRGWVDF
jgi:hemolysin activation/secretion protein